MESNLSVVLIEDSAKDARQAYQVLQQLNIEATTAFTYIPSALKYLEDVVEGNKTCPDLILLDLMLGTESGFEVLRYFKMHPQLSKCHVVVWTAMEDLQLRELCRHFGVEHVVSKDDGAGALLKVLKKLTSELAASASSSS